MSHSLITKQLALITGATKGIGRAVVETFAAEGFDLALCARSESDLTALEQELNANYPALTIFHRALDCANQAQLMGFIDEVLERFESVAVLVNNAGLYLPAAMMDEADGSLEQMMNTNVFSAYYLSKYIAGRMIEEGKGHIFNICSVAALQPVLEAGSYSVSKFALLGLSRALSQELAPHGVKVTAILPGATLTNSWAGTTIPTKHFVLPHDVASAILSAWKMSEGALVDEIVIRPGIPR